nr:hypothetical protein [Tanacetum cinerariifolium]
EKTSKVQDDPKKVELPQSSSSLYVSSGFGDQFFKLSFDSSLASTVKDSTDAKINSLLEAKIYAPKSKPATSKTKLKGPPSLTLEDKRPKTLCNLLKKARRQGDEQDSEFFDDDNDDDEKVDKDIDTDDEGNDHINDTQDADDEDVKTKSL